MVKSLFFSFVGQKQNKVLHLIFPEFMVLVIQSELERNYIFLLYFSLAPCATRG